MGLLRGFFEEKNIQIAVPDGRTVFMPYKTYRLISQMYDVALNCLAYWVYLKDTQKFKSNRVSQNEKLIATHNAYYDLCVLHWCMLFGEKNSEKTHMSFLTDPQYKLEENFKQIGIILLNRETLKKYIFDNAKLDKQVFKKFRKNTLLYRNKILVHREHDPDIVQDGWIVRPLTQEIMKSTFALYMLIINLVNTFPASSSHQSKYQFNYYMFRNMTELQKYFLYS